MKEANLEMSGPEIRNKIIANNKIIEEGQKSMFVLDRKVLAAIEENKHLRQICKHDFDELGYCKFCDTKVE